MQLKYLIPILFIALAGLLFLRAGMTGLAVSETCCFGPDCAQENLCDVARSPQIQEQEWLSFAVTAIVISGLSYLILHQKHH